MSEPRPFRVGDRVVVTDHVRHLSSPIAHWAGFRGTVSAIRLNSSDRVTGDLVEVIWDDQRDYPTEPNKSVVRSVFLDHICVLDLLSEIKTDD